MIRFLWDIVWIPMQIFLLNIFNLVFSEYLSFSGGYFKRYMILIISKGSFQSKGGIKTISLCNLGFFPWDRSFLESWYCLILQNVIQRQLTVPFAFLLVLGYPVYILSFFDFCGQAVWSPRADEMEISMKLCVYFPLLMQSPPHNDAALLRMYLVFCSGLFSGLCCCFVTFANIFFKATQMFIKFKESKI